MTDIVERLRAYEEMDDAYLENMPYSPFPDLDSTYPSTPGK